MKRVLAGAFALLILSLLFMGVPKYEEIRQAEAQGERAILDRKGEVLFRERGTWSERRGQWIELNAIPIYLQKALLSAEDRRFYQHPGVDPLALAALPIEWARGQWRGASTLPMQLCKHWQDRTFAVWDKVRQMHCALRLTMRWSKDEVLETYLNLLPLRGELVGVDAAARGIFKKELHGLTREEMKILVALIPRPNASASEVAARACRLPGEASCAAIERRAAATLNVRPRFETKTTLTPHYIRRLPKDVRQTTIDADLQRLAEEAVREQLLQLEKQNVRDAAVLLADAQSGEILVYVGSSGSLSSAAEVDGVRALRQAGSTLKPFLYQQAFAKRLLTPDSLLRDEPVQIMTAQGLYAPANYGQHYRGVVPARSALASSLNAPAIRVIDLLGVDAFYEHLESLGFTLGERWRYGHSLALGAVDVSLWQLVEAYGALARGGSPLSLRLQRDSSQAMAPKKWPEFERAAVTDILSDRSQRSLGFGLSSVLGTPYFAAVKTGTSKDMRDNWCVGFTERFVLAVWVGNFNGEPMWNVSGTDGAAPIWRTIMDRLQHSPRTSDTESVTKLKTLPNLVATRILYPPEGAWIAFDPDIPDPNQRIVLETEGASESLVWWLNEHQLPGNSIGIKDLASGRNTLQLKDGDGLVLDEVKFYLRGKPAG